MNETIAPQPLVNRFAIVLQSFVFRKNMNITSTLFSLRDIEYRDFQSRLIPNIDKDAMIGVRTPALRKLASELFGTPEAAEFMAEVPHVYFDENNLHAFLIERIKDYPAAIEAVEAFLPYIDNWATCDQLRVKVFSKHTEPLLEKIREWTASDRVYTCRFGIEMLMTYFLGDKFLPEYNDLAASARGEDYYVRMMVAWYFATALAKRYEATLPYLESRALETRTHNKAIQKACESRRLTQEQKLYLRKLKV